MLRHIACGGLVICCLAASSPAAIIVDFSSVVPLPNLPGYQSVTVRVTSTVAGELIQGVDFAGDGSNDPATGKGFFGSMNQVGPPLINTTFMDNNNLIPLLNPGKTSAEDSQFLITTTQANVALPSGFAEESPTILQGLWAWTEPQGQSVAFAQIVTNGFSLSFRGSFSLNTPQGIVDTATISSVLPFPNKPSFVSPTIDNVDPNQPGFVDYIWSPPAFGGTYGNLQFDSYVPASGATGTGPAIAATLDPAQRKFHWDTVGSPLGSYKWLVTATNVAGSTTGSITVNVTVPEPSGVALLGIASLLLLKPACRGRRVSRGNGRATD